MIYRVFLHCYFLSLLELPIYMAKIIFSLLTEVYELSLVVVYKSSSPSPLPFFPFQHVLPKGQNIPLATMLHLTRGARITVSFLPPVKAMSWLDT